MTVAKRIAPRSAGRESDTLGSARNRKLRPKGKSRAGLWIGLMALLFLESLVYAWCRVQCVNTGFAIDHETSRHQALLRERSTLKIELARLKSPGRIETIARTRLGLISPQAQQTMRRP
ncbi:conserved hypothetical protein [Desulfosarcina cetonica]|nr:conserved hypothetical protein [Desulfosarcina cetonica]